MGKIKLAFLDMQREIVLRASSGPVIDQVD
jgi:hypothetical protein